MTPHSEQPGSSLPHQARDLKFRELAAQLREQIRDGSWPPGSRMPTELELARSSGTSVSTVRRAVDDLVAEGLVSRRQGAGTFIRATPGEGSARAANRPLVGVLVPDTTFYFPRVLQGIEEGLSAAGARLLLACSGYEAAREEKELKDLLDAGVQGLLLVPTLIREEPYERYLRRLAALEVPNVLMERRATSLGATNEYVCSNHEAGAYDAVRHLAALGHRTIALTLREGSPTTDPVRHGFHQAIAELGCTADEFSAKREEWSPATADRCVAALRDAGATAAVCFGDRQAILLLAAARRAGLTVPADLALVAYDDEIADLAEVPLTAVAPPKHQLGRTAAELLLNRLGRPELPSHQILLRPGITVRASCGSARTAPAP